MTSRLQHTSLLFCLARKRPNAWGIVLTAFVLPGCASMSGIPAGAALGRDSRANVSGTESSDPTDKPPSAGTIDLISGEDAAAEDQWDGEPSSFSLEEGEEADVETFSDTRTLSINEPSASDREQGMLLAESGDPRESAARWLRNPFALGDWTADSQESWFLDTLRRPDEPNDGRPAPADPGGAEGPGGPGGPDGGPPGGFGGQDEPGYAATWYPSAAVAGQGGQMGIVHQRLGVDVPVWFQGKDAVMMSLSVDETHFSGHTVLPETQRAFPSDIWNIQVGLKYMHQLSNGWTGMMMVDVGSASDKPFHSLREVNVQLGGFLIIPAKNERDSWMLGVLYSPLGSPSFPIPLLSYHWKPSDTFEMNIGLPCSMKWQATDRLSFDLSYFPILSVDALATYKLSEQLHLYGGYQNVSRSWFLSDRAHKNDQFFANERRLIVGLKHEFTESMKLDLNTGYSFDREFGVGDFQTSLSDQVDLESGLFVGGRFTWNF